MDLVTRNLVTSFRKEEGLAEDIPDDELFEHFGNFCALSNEYADDFGIDDLRVGGGDDLSIDGIGIILNGNMITSTDEVEDLEDTNKYLDAEFVFVQSKSGRSFEGADISSFFLGVTQIFPERIAFPHNDEIAVKHEIIQAIYQRSVLFKKGNPKVKLYYMTTGKWQDDPNLVKRIEVEREKLLDQNIFESVDFIPVDARALQRLYNRAKSRVSATITFANKVTVPAVDDVRESYIGLLPAPDFLALITDESDNIARGLFYDNVRDFQGANPVNVEIDHTLKQHDRNLFVLLNNGVTIVADSLSKTGDQFTIEGYQIVNGCQTSHVLFNNREILTDEIFIPVKLIITDDDEIQNRVIKATNRQTQVKTEELSALTDFQKHLEQYYAAVPEEHRLYYERRSQQYRSISGIEKVKIVSISVQIRCFSSMFLDQPHRASRYYGTLLKSVENKIFMKGHPAIAYYVSAYALYRLESFFRRKQIDNKYRPFKYHALMIFRLLASGKDMPSMSANKFNTYCSTMQKQLWDEVEALRKFMEVMKIVEDITDGDLNRDRAKDNKLIDAAYSVF